MTMSVQSTLYGTKPSGVLPRRLKASGPSQYSQVGSQPALRCCAAPSAVRMTTKSDCSWLPSLSASMLTWIMSDAMLGDRTRIDAGLGLDEVGDAVVLAAGGHEVVAGEE